MQPRCFGHRVDELLLCLGGGLSLPCMAAGTDIDVGSLTVRELLRLSARIVTELISRHVLRSRNAPAGDLAEYLVAKTYQGELAKASAKSWDVQAGRSQAAG
jgi:hypothetical protein